MVMLNPSRQVNVFSASHKASNIGIIFNNPNVAL